MRDKWFARLSILLLAALAACNLPLPGASQPPPPPARPTPPRAAAPSPLPPLPSPTITAPPAPTPTLNPAASLQRPSELQLGLNFIRFYWAARGEGLDTTTPCLQPDAIFADFHELGVDAYRQFIKADLFWDVVEPRDGEWNFAQADAVVTHPEFEPLVTLFRIQYASPTPPWALTPQEFQKTLGTEATDYLTTVVRRYAPYVRYWEIGNEMDHWKAADPAMPQKQAMSGEEKLPPYAPASGFSPQEQGIFLAQAAAIIRQNDPDALIVMPGMSSPGEYPTQTWLPGVLQGGGKDWFDIVNYHDYGGWEPFTLLRPRLAQTLDGLGIGDRPVWNTETGSTSSPTLTLRTDYPNSDASQASDVFRRLVAAWGHGDRLVVWHTYISHNDRQGDWQAYGLRDAQCNPRPSYYAFRLLAQELTPFERVEKIAVDGRGLNVYRVAAADGRERYVAWGAGNFSVPEGMTQMVSVVPPASGQYEWQTVAPGQSIPLAPEPVLMR